MDATGGRLLVVCTANVCRSPLAEAVLADRLGPTVAVSSAGARALVGAGICPVSAAELPEGSSTANGHTARQVDRPMIERADLVLAMEREQRGLLVREAPGSQAKVFTLRELLLLAEVLDGRGAAPVADLRALAAALHGARGLATPAEPPPSRRWFRRPVPPGDPITIADGHGLDPATHLAAARSVHETSVDVAAVIARLVPA